jgi:hypothetical protein
MDRLVVAIWLVLLCVALAALNGDAIARKIRKHK